MSTIARQKEFDFLTEFDRFIRDSRSGKRLQPNGRRIAIGTLANYEFTLRLLRKFSVEKQFGLRIRPARWLNGKMLRVEKNYWKKFYRLFTAYLYEECGYFDNYVGQTIKNVKVFFNYMNKEKLLDIGSFHKQFYVRKEQITIFPLLPEELNLLVFDREFEKSLRPRLREVKDFFVFGCTVALRFSDLNALTKSNVRQVNSDYYLGIRSKKTGIDTFVKLPCYCVDIIKRYNKIKKKLLPSFNKSNLNKFIKQLLAQAGFTQCVSITRSRRGKSIELKQEQEENKMYRFCDVACTHSMRRTAITTMLSLGVPEQIVRKISGHSPGSKDFYRYVHVAQAYQDQETSKVFDKLKEKQLVVNKN